MATSAGLAHDLFQRRTEPANFNPRYLARLRSALENALTERHGDNQLLFELAFTLLENQATRPTVLDTQLMLVAVDTDTVHDDGDVARLRELAAGMTARAESEPIRGRVIGKVNWAVTNDCPMVCRGCYHAFVADRLTLDQGRYIVDKLAAHGTRHLVLSGGDSLLWPHIFDLLDHLRDTDITVVLDTTGLTLDRTVLERVSQSVALLRLPLDGSDSHVQDQFRRAPRRDLFPRLLDSLRLCDELGFDRVTVHTVVSSKNLADLGRIGGIVDGLRCVSEWVMFQWWPRRAPRKVVAEMFVEREYIAEAVSELRRAYPRTTMYFAPPTTAP